MAQSPQIRASLEHILKFEGGYNPHDKGKLPTYNGITTDTWQIWLKEMGIKATKAQAADDLRYIASQDGKPYSGEAARDLQPFRENRKHGHSGIGLAKFRELYFTKSEQTYLTRPGFDKINSVAIQAYILEDSFRRGPDSARWLMNNITEIEPDHANPLLSNKIAPSDNRKDAVIYTNGFLATGRRNTVAKPGDYVIGTAEQRLYGRMRTISIMQEMHLIADRGLPELSSGLLKRAFEFPWPLGLDKNHPGLDPVKDKEFYDTYAGYKKLYDQYSRQEISPQSFVRQVMAVAQEELCDPHSAANKTKLPDYCPPTQPHAKPKGKDVSNLVEISTQTHIPPAAWPTNKQLGERFFGDVSYDEMLGKMYRTVAPKEGLDAAALAAYYTNPNKPAPFLLAPVQTVRVQYRNLNGNEAIAIDIPGKGTVFYSINAVGEFIDFNGKLPKDVVPAYNKKEDQQLITWKTDDDKLHVIPLDTVVNNRIRDAEIEKLTLKSSVPRISLPKLPILPDSIPGAPDIPRVPNVFFNMENNPMDLVKDKITNPDKPQHLKASASDYLIVETPSVLLHEKFLVYSDRDHVYGAPAGTTLPHAPKPKAR